MCSDTKAHKTRYCLSRMAHCISNDFDGTLKKNALSEERTLPRSSEVGHSIVSLVDTYCLVNGYDRLVNQDCGLLQTMLHQTTGIISVGI